VIYPDVSSPAILEIPVYTNRYDVFSRSRVENAITHVGNVVESRSIAKSTDTRAYVQKDDLTKTPTVADYG
jgi:hypothetical protein